jgi:hypothetical protein
MALYNGTKSLLSEPGNSYAVCVGVGGVLLPPLCFFLFFVMISSLALS